MVKMRVLILALIAVVVAVTVNAAAYDRTRDLYYALESGEGGNDAARWREVADKFAAAERADPKGKRAADALYMAGKCFEFALRLSNEEDDGKRALGHYKRLYVNHSKISLADDALFRSARLFENTAEKKSARKLYKKIIADYPDGDMLALAEKRLSLLDKGVEVVGVRHWSGDKYTRIVIDLSGLSPYKVKTLPANPAGGKPPRVFVDLSNSRLKNETAGRVEVLDGLVSQVRAAQFDATTVRVVMDLKSSATHRVFPLLSPDRLVIDVFRDEASGPVTAADDPVASIIDEIRSEAKVPVAPSGVKPKATRKPAGKRVAKKAKRPLRIVIDPGHGGKDPGAVGYKRLMEKEVTLGISLALARKLKKTLNCEVKLTRDRDVWLSLSQRTAIANRFGADLFISVHANASRSKKARGIETYYLDRSSDRSARRVAAVENKTTVDGVRETEQILADVLLNMKLPESKRLATNIQKSMLSSVSKRYGQVRDLGIKRAPFYVLTGAAMPAVLLETGFVSNKTDAKRLKTKEYQQLMADSVASAVARHAEGL
jgi:N-acetylmuramoyl-L-alanine amidase